MSCITLNAGYKLGCPVSGGSKILYLANYVTNNSYVKDSGDASGSYSAVADAGSGLIEITADNGSGAHGLVEGAVVTLSGGAYDGTYTVVSVPTTTTFTVEATFTATDAGSYACAPDTNVIIGTSVANGTALDFYKIEQEIETIEYTTSGVGSRENGTFYEEQTLTFVLFSSKDQASEVNRKKLFDQLVKGRFVALVEDNNGVKKLLGAVNGMRVSAGSNDSGLALGDLAGSTITLTGKEPEIAFIYDETGDSSSSPAEPFTPFNLL